MHLKHRARLYVPYEEQVEANAYWAGKDYKKWVVLFSHGPAKTKSHQECYVGAGTHDEAVIAGREYLKITNPELAKRRGVSVSARLATYVDLGAKRVMSV